MFPLPVVQVRNMKLKHFKVQVQVEVDVWLDSVGSRRDHLAYQPSTTTQHDHPRLSSPRADEYMPAMMQILLLPYSVPRRPLPPLMPGELNSKEKDFRLLPLLSPLPFQSTGPEPPRTQPHQAGK
jgi:hypothetical protein